MMVSLSNPSSPSSHTITALIGALVGSMCTALVLRNHKKKKNDPEEDATDAHQIVWKSIGGALQAAMLYIGDKLELYKVLSKLCQHPDASVSAAVLATATGLHERWLREWLNQQVGMGVLTLLPASANETDETLRYRLPAATARVLADPTSSDYDIAMVQTVPALTRRAQTMLPQAFSTGIGRPYDEPDVASAIDRHHAVHIQHCFLPRVLPMVPGLVDLLEQQQGGVRVADLGCGGGSLLTAMASRFSECRFDGYEISSQALDRAAYSVAQQKLTNCFLHKADEAGEALGDAVDTFDVVTTFDVLHDCTQPQNLIAQVKSALKPGGYWLLADIPARPSTRENISQLDTGLYLAFSTTLCMSCALSEPGGAGLGTLGFSVPVAQRLLIDEGGFNSIEVLLEEASTRWFLVR